jgi:hypothetical protein
MGVVVACVLPDRILPVILLDNKSVGSSLASHTLKDIATGAILCKLDLHFGHLCVGTYECPAALASEYPKAATALCLVQSRVDAPEAIDVSDRAPGPVAVSPTRWLAGSYLLTSLWAIRPPLFVRANLVAAF